MTYVSAVMPTTPGRAHYVEKSIRYFLTQKFPDVDLTIYSEEFSQVLDALVHHESINYIYGRAAQQTHQPIGAARNAVNAWVEGEIIIHWDDDDWYAPERVGDQVGHLIASGKQVVGYHDMLYYREEDGATFSYRYKPSKDMPLYATGTSQCYWHKYWEQNPFPDLNIGEDSAFSIRASNQNLLDSKDNCGMLVARTHVGSTSKPAFGSVAFPLAAAEEFPKAFLAEVEHERRLSR